MKIEKLTRRITAGFEKICGRPPRWIAAAPGRVNLIGEHTDYNDGFVLPMAIERYTLIAAAPNRSDHIHLRSGDADGAAIIDLRQPLRPRPRGEWVNYPAGVLAGFLARNLEPPGFDALIQTTVPLGAGLSSSAALEVATAALLEVVTGRRLDPAEKALLCQKAEHDFAGMPCGIMDQFISVMARENHLMLLDCRSRKPELVPMTDPSVEVLIIDTNVKHELTGSEYPTRRRQCEAAAKALGLASLRDATPEQLERGKGRMDGVVHRRARHVVSEIERTLRAAEGVRRGEWASVGRDMYASHCSLRDDYEVSCPELDAVVEIAQGIGPAGGVIGCRMTGGGFGGCAVALVETEAVEAILQKIAGAYRRQTGIEAAMFVSRPARGATILKA